MTKSPIVFSRFCIAYPKFGNYEYNGVLHSLHWTQ